MTKINNKPNATTVIAIVFSFAIGCTTLSYYTYKIGYNEGYDKGPQVFVECVTNKMIAGQVRVVKKCYEKYR